MADDAEFVNRRVEELQIRQSSELEAMRAEIARGIPNGGESLPNSTTELCRGRVNDWGMSTPPDLSQMNWVACKSDRREGDTKVETSGRKTDANMTICASISKQPEFNPDRSG